MAEHCVCYTTDDGYLLPTLISALQARNHVDAQTGVVICYIGVKGRKAEGVDEVCRTANIEFINVGPEAIDRRHIMFARLFLDRIVSPNYDHLLYVDGDTQVTGGLQPLLDAPLPSGAFLAAPDPMVLMLDSDGRGWRQRRAYFDSIGLRPEQQSRYFNTGVLSFARKDLGEIRAACMKSPAWRIQPLQFPDQDILNIACGERAVPMSFKWNFPIFFLNCGFRAPINPRLFHFMSNPRPWHGPLRPWGDEFFAVYGRLVAEHPGLVETLPSLPRWKLAKYWLQQHIKALVESKTWNTSRMHEKLLGLEARASV